MPPRVCATTHTWPLYFTLNSLNSSFLIGPEMKTLFSLVYLFRFSKLKTKIAQKNSITNSAVRVKRVFVILV